MSFAASQTKENNVRGEEGPRLCLTLAPPFEEALCGGSRRKGGTSGMTDVIYKRNFL